MTEKNNVIKKKDFEKYSILLPFVAAYGKRRKQYLCAELEKVHPCFSDEFCFDSSVKKITRKGLSADVFVMNKATLAEYEQKRHLNGTGFVIENGRKFKRLFVNDKWKGAVAGVIACVFVTGGGLLCGAMFGVTARTNLINIEEKADSNEACISLTKSEGEFSDFSDYVGENDLFNNSSNDPSNNPSKKTSFLWKDFLDVVNDADGKITFVEWSIDGFSENLKASIKSVFPESLLSLNIWKKNLKNDSVIYEKGVPFMQLDYSKKISTVAQSELMPCKMSDSEFTKTIRDTLKSFGAELRQENAPPYHIEFSLPYKTDRRKLFYMLDEIIRNDNRAVTFFSTGTINKSNSTANADFRAALSIQPVSDFSGRITSGFNLKYFSDYDLMQGVEIIENPVLKIQVNNTKNLNSEILGEKIGEIKTSGNTIIFYKNAEGKMVKKIQKMEVLK